MAIRSTDDLKIQLDKCGYTDLKQGKTRSTVVVQLEKGSDREGALRNIATKLKGRYNPSGGTSSVGRAEMGTYYVEVKIKGGGGSGAGSDITKLAESAQCVYNAACYAKKPYTHAGLKGASSKYDVDEKIENVLTKLPDDWIASSKLVAAQLKKKFPSTTYKHHRGSAWVNNLYKHVNLLNREAGKPFGDANKWSPADIWMVTPKGATVNLTSAKTFTELNEMLIKNFISKDIIGVSLKKCVGRVNYKELNLGRERPTFKYERTTTGLRGFFESGDGYLFFNGGKAQFRRFGATWQGELKGKNANMGKMSGGPIKGLVDMIIGPGKSFIPQRELSERNDETIKKFYDWYTACPDTNKMDEYEFYKAVMEKDMNWFVSKIMTTQLISIVESMSKKNKDRFASGLVNYAGSESELSGPYAKVY